VLSDSSVSKTKTKSSELYDVGALPGRHCRYHHCASAGDLQFNAVGMKVSREEDVQSRLKSLKQSKSPVDHCPGAPMVLDPSTLARRAATVLELHCTGCAGTVP